MNIETTNFNRIFKCYFQIDLRETDNLIVKPKVTLCILYKDIIIFTDRRTYLHTDKQTDTHTDRHHIHKASRKSNSLKVSACQESIKGHR